MTYEEIYQAGYEDGVHDGYYSSSIEDGTEERYFGKSYQEQPTSDDCISRQAVVKYIETCGAELGHDIENESVREDILNMPPVIPTHGTCKDCKHWKDSDGVYRRGIGAESKCPVNNSRVFEGTFCCADFEKRGNENGNK